MVAALHGPRVHCLLCGSAILRVHQNLELFKRHGFLCRRFPFLLEFKTSAFWIFGGNHELRRSNPASGFEAEGPDILRQQRSSGDHLIEQNETPELRQMCAKVHPLSDRPPRSSDEPAGHEQARIHRSCCVTMLWPVPRKRSSVPVPWIKGACNAHSDRHHPEQSPPWAVASTRRPARSFPLDLCSRSRASTTVVWFNSSPSQFRDTKPFEGRVGEQVSVPVRACLLARP
jgi:hypothetical protein